MDHPRGVWVSTHGSALAEWITTSGRTHSSQRLLLLGDLPSTRWELLRAWFEFAVREDGYRLLPREDLFDVLTSEQREDRFIGVAADKEAGAVLLLRGNLEPLVVPVSWFRNAPGMSEPNLDDYEITDWGNTVRLGEYEASADAILYSFDRDYRKRAKARKVEQDRTFGGALRRLRLLKGLGRSDFPDISAKEIARIERGEVERPHAATLKLLADRLDVPPEEIESY
ncbi:MAG TPA: helix-turn-helix transcriptional regulator [Polyangiaceae bacterium]|nr:helix-turn-helix transcriptional regulator [Polyangiaceae bacterium]